jgi:hypothetical protein
MKTFNVKGNKKSSGVYGNSMEYHMGIKPNSSKNSDLLTGDIKTHKKNSSSPITLLSITPKGSLTESFIMEYGNYENERFNFNASISTKGTNIYGKNNFYINVDRKNEKINLIANDKLLDFCWSFDLLKKRAFNKIKNIHFYLIDPIGDIVNIEREIYYQNLNFDNFINEIENGNIIIGFACSLKKGKKKNHGCTFRTNHNNFTKFYEKIKIIE